MGKASGGKKPEKSAVGLWTSPPVVLCLAILAGALSIAALALYYQPSTSAVLGGQECCCGADDDMRPPQCVNNVTKACARHPPMKGRDVRFECDVSDGTLYVQCNDTIPDLAADECCWMFMTFTNGSMAPGRVPTTSSTSTEVLTLPTTGVTGSQTTTRDTERTTVVSSGSFTESAADLNASTTVTTTPGGQESKRDVTSAPLTTPVLPGSLQYTPRTPYFNTSTTVRTGSILMPLSLWLSRGSRRSTRIAFGDATHVACLQALNLATRVASFFLYGFGLLLGIAWVITYIKRKLSVLKLMSTPWIFILCSHVGLTVLRIVSSPEIPTFPAILITDILVTLTMLYIVVSNAVIMLKWETARQAYKLDRISERISSMFYKRKQSPRQSVRLSASGVPTK